MTGIPRCCERHQEILRAAWTAWGGCEVKTDGDSFFVAFSVATAAIEACAQAQRDLTSEPWPADAVIRVRMGVHTGLASPHGDDYIALAVHQAARVVDAGHGGQIVVSAETAEQVSDASRQTLATLGRYRVRDFDDPVELFQVAAPDLPAEFPPLRVLPADRHNLVGAPTTIVGRDDDLRRADRPRRSIPARERRRTGRSRQDPSGHRVRDPMRQRLGPRRLVRRPRTAQRPGARRPDRRRRGGRVRSMPSGTHWRRCWSISGIAAPW